MSRRYLNNSNIPLSLAVFLATDTYDHDSSTISATALLKPLKQLILAQRVPVEDRLADLASQWPSVLGRAVHDGIERAWLHHHQTALAALGYPENVRRRVLINPTKEELFEGCIPVYLEQRAYREIDGFVVSGKFDFVGDGRVEDFKNTSVYAYQKQTHSQKFTWQGSIYRWLNPELITQDELAIQYILSDWSAMKAKADPKYPQARSIQQLYRLESVANTEAFVRSKLAQLLRYRDADEDDIPPCSDEDLWRSDPVFKYYKNPAVTSRSTKNFDNLQDANLRLIQDGSVGKVVEVPGKATACRYCPAVLICKQAQALAASGDLEL